VLLASELAGLVISGAWATDNFCSILLNGATPLGTGAFELAGVVSGNFSRFHEFSISSGFVVGLNTIDLVVVDTGSVGGLNVSRLVAGTVPEPPLTMLLALSLAFATSRAARDRMTS
jgi:hypothetical protein